jgi:DNA repair ATPase RecN
MTLPARLLAAAVLAAALAQPAGAADRRFPDWPCVQARVPSLSAAAVWTGPPIEEVLGAWREDARLAELVARVSARRMPREEAERAVVQFVEGLGAERAEQTRLLVAGLFETLDSERGQVIAGLERLTRRQRDLVSRIEADMASLRALQDDPAADPKRVEEIATRVQWSTRIFEERRRSVRFVCEVPVQIEQRFFTLTRAAQDRLR